MLEGSIISFLGTISLVRKVSFSEKIEVKWVIRTMKQDRPFRVLLVRPPYTRLKGLGQAPYYPLGIGYLAAVISSLHNTEVRTFYPENPSPTEKDFLIDKENVLYSRSQAQKKYLNVLDQDNHYIWNEIQEVLNQYKPDLVGLSVLTPEVGSALKISSIAKKLLHKCTIVWGGVHPTFCPENTIKLQPVDFVVIGEGEQLICDLITAIQSHEDPSTKPGIISKNTNKFASLNSLSLINELDSIPFPARDKSWFPNRFSPVAMGSIMHSRGCPWRCGFCSSRLFWHKKVRFRSAENVLEEIQHIQSEYNIRLFTFWDDAFTADRSMTERLCEAIISQNMKIGWRTATRLDLLDDRMLKLMKRAGCMQLELGIESGSHRMLQLIQKDIDLEEVPEIIDRVQRYGMACGVFMMAGFPDETYEDIRKTHKFIQRIKPAEVVLNIFDPMPGSQQYERAIELGLLPENPDFIHFPLWPDAHFVQGVEPDIFNELIADLSHTVFEYNNSRAALIRRAKPEILQLLRTDKKVLLQKSFHFLKRRFSGKQSAK